MEHGGSGTLGDLRSAISRGVNDHIAFFMIVPTFILIGFVFVYPVFRLLYQSFHLSTPGIPSVYVGLDNYVQILESGLFWSFVENTFLYATGSLLLTITFGLLIALAINHVHREYLKGFYTTVLMFPWAIPVAVVGLMWRWLLAGNQWGFVNRLLLDLNLIQNSIPWLAKSSMALPLVVMVDAWMRVPFAMIIFLAGLQSIPQHMYDAARVDGATTLQAFWNITIPYLRPYFAVVGLITWIFAFRSFSLIFALTGGGPGTATTTLSIHIYQRGMQNLRFGYASAVATILVVFSLVIAVYYVKITIERSEE